MVTETGASNGKNQATSLAGTKQKEEGPDSNQYRYYHHLHPYCLPDYFRSLCRLQALEQCVGICYGELN